MKSLLIALYSCWLMLAGYAAAQTVVTLELTDKAILHTIGVGQNTAMMLDNPYTFEPLDFKSEFIRALFAQARKGQMKLYRDSALTLPYRYQDIEQEHYFLPYMLSKKYLKNKLPSNAEALPDYTLSLHLIEAWRPDEGQRNLQAGFLMLQDERKPHLAGTRFYFRTLPGALARQLVMYRDYPAGPLSAEDVFANRLFNFRVAHVAGPALASGWQNRLAELSAARHAELLQQHPASKSPYSLQIPGVLGPDNFSPGLLPKTAYDFERNTQLFQQAAPVLFRAILQQKIPLYRWPYQKERVDGQTLKATIQQHPAAANYPLTKQNLKQVDYSFGVIDLTVTGTVLRTGGQVRFQPAYIGLVWGASGADPFRTLIGYVRYQDVVKAGVKVNNAPLGDFLAEWRYYPVLYQVGSAMPRHLAESFYILHLLRSGKWEELPTQNQLRQMEEDTLRRKEIGRAHV